jgi:hypothetical protein
MLNSRGPYYRPDLGSSYLNYMDATRANYMYRPTTDKKSEVASKPVARAEAKQVEAKPVEAVSVHCCLFM